MALEDQRPVDLFESGLMWHINKSVLHPRGFALGHDTETGEIVLLGDGTESWTYDHDTDQEGWQKFNAWLQEVLD